MKWIEIIECRSDTSSMKTLEESVQKLINQIEDKSENYSIRIFNRHDLETDISIHIIHESDRYEKLESQLGLHLVSIMNEYGLVNYAIWIEPGTIDM